MPLGELGKSEPRSLGWISVSTHLGTLVQGTPCRTVCSGPDPHMGIPDNQILFSLPSSCSPLPAPAGTATTLAAIPAMQSLPVYLALAQQHYLPGRKCPLSQQTKISPPVNFKHHPTCKDSMFYHQEHSTTSVGEVLACLPSGQRSSKAQEGRGQKQPAVPPRVA